MRRGWVVVRRRRRRRNPLDTLTRVSYCRGMDMNDIVTVTRPDGTTFTGKVAAWLIDCILIHTDTGSRYAVLGLDKVERA